MSYSKNEALRASDDQKVFQLFDNIRINLSLASIPEICEMYDVSESLVKSVSRAMKWPDLSEKAKSGMRTYSKRVLRWAEDRFGYAIFEAHETPSRSGDTKRHFSVSLSSDLAEYVMIMSAAASMNSSQFLQNMVNMHKKKHQGLYDQLRTLRGLDPEGGDE